VAETLGVGTATTDQTTAFILDILNSLTVAELAQLLIPTLHIDESEALQIAEQVQLLIPTLYKSVAASLSISEDLTISPTSVGLTKSVSAALSITDVVTMFLGAVIDDVTAWFSGYTTSEADSLAISELAQLLIPVLHIDEAEALSIAELARTQDSRSV
jgi:hypothetical protein